jgi:hypothetical protein
VGKKLGPENGVGTLEILLPVFGLFSPR